MADIRIGVVPLGHVPEIASKSIAAHIQGYTGLNTDTHPALDPPEYALDKHRLQYNAGTILMRLEQEPFPDYDKVIAVLDLDIFVPILTHVFGEAKQGGKFALVSLYRLRKNPEGSTSPLALSLERVAKVALHELGHLFGLVHCMDDKCLMHFSGKLQDLDLSPLYFCRYCSIYFRDFLKRPFTPSQSRERF
ncbi:MAG: archaemetzincin family Zn-dependent metalloprotease [Pseudomonadota bacterium]